MPTTNSAKKSLRQDAKRNMVNKSRKTALKTQVKKFLTAIQNKDVQAAETEYRLTVKKMDKGAAKGILHKKNASRKKSRYAKKLYDLKTSVK
ncbi:MAG: 30S ribosomal protein S20 [Candidatus Kuenenia sp.]|nr:30S ribosomal protein S20 [Candidatus Kuenenia hertensis]